MEVRTQNKNGPVVTTVDEVLGQLQEQLHQQQTQWLEQLREQPESFADLEANIHQTLQQAADQIVAGVLAEATAPKSFSEDAKKKILEPPVRPLRSPEKRTLKLRLLGGLLLWVTTLYCAPKARTGTGGRGREGGGLYPEWSALRIQEGKTPALVREVSRQVALLPSYEIARGELERRGLSLDIKEVHNIATYAGEAVLAYRRRLLEQYRNGHLPVGQALAGKRVGVFVDGGRTKIRKVTRRQKGRGQTKKQKRRYQSHWREPKLLIIYEFDDSGRMVPGSQSVIDGTFSGPDELMEVLAMHLHRLGAASAAAVSLGADGAPWVWDRWDWVIQRVGLDSSRVVKTLDWCHASHHISLALSHLLANEADRRQTYKQLRGQLKRGHWSKVVMKLVELAESLPDTHAVWTEISYLEQHGLAGHLDYGTYRRRGLPLGSGAIESAIRRVINLRMKGNSISWKEPVAEGMLVLRGMVLTQRWDEEFAAISTSMASDRKREWRFESPDMPAQLRAGEKICPPSPQVPGDPTGYNAAA